jgi:integrase
MAASSNRQPVVVPELGRARLSKLTPMQVQQVLNRKLEDGLAPRTVQYMRAVLRAALAQAVRWRLIELNAAALVEGPRAAAAGCSADPRRCSGAA